MLAQRRLDDAIVEPISPRNNISGSAGPLVTLQEQLASEPGGAFIRDLKQA
jgi:hypothetical protein